MPKYDDIPKFVRGASYTVQHDWKYLPNVLADWRKRCVKGKNVETEDGLELDPEFQRGHVWTRNQQIAYLEFALKGGNSGRDIYWNNPTWQGSYTAKTVLVDGKQRLTAVLLFLKGELPIFGHPINEWEGRLPREATFTFHVNMLKTDAEVIQWYLDMNSGGTPHTSEE